MSSRPSDQRLASSDKRLDWRVLRTVAEHETPVGAGTIQIELARGDCRTSPATVGRVLRDLEVRGLLAKVGVEGRRLTASGRLALVELDRESNLEARGQALLDALREPACGRQDVLALLAARRPVEVEVARLAALHASWPQVAEMTGCIERQRSLVARGELGVDADIAFHETVAAASGNSYLHVITSLLRRHGGYAETITRIRRRSGHALVVDHRRILEAVAARDPAGAAAAAEDHIAKLTREVEEYWSGEERSE